MKKRKIKRRKKIKNKIKRNTLKTDLGIFTIKNVKTLFSMKITKVISFLPVTVRKIKLNN